MLTLAQANGIIEGAFAAATSDRVPPLTVVVIDAAGDIVSAQRQDGAVLIRDAGGAIIGAVGASGGTGDEDEACCLSGIEHIGLASDA